MDTKMKVEGLVKKFTLSHMSVRHIAIKDETTVAAYTANMFIPVINIETGKVIHRFEMANQVAGLHFSESRPDVLYAIDDSFGLHVFDIKQDTKRKYRMNPEVERHTVTCTALAGHILAVASTTFGGEIFDVRVSRTAPRHNHILTLFDVRNPSEPITTYRKSHSTEISSMEFFKNDKDLLVCDKSGAVRIYNTEKRDEDNALRWTRYIKAPATLVGLINKRIAYAIGGDGEINVIINTKGTIDILFGNVAKTPIPEGTKTVSPATYCLPRKLVALVKGVTDELPLVAVWGKEGDHKLRFTAMNQQGVQEEKNMLSYIGHEGVIKCFSCDKSRLVTGGEDGKMIVRTVDFKAEGFGKPKKDKKKYEDSQGSSSSSEEKKEKSKKHKSSRADDEGPSTSKKSKHHH